MGASIRLEHAPPPDIDYVGVVVGEGSTSLAFIIQEPRTSASLDGADFHLHVELDLAIAASNGYAETRALAGAHVGVLSIDYATFLACVYNLHLPGCA